MTTSPSMTDGPQPQRQASADAPQADSLRFGVVAAVGVVNASIAGWQILLGRNAV